ncbi:MAG: tetratricopeptide repeat protein [Campylobacter sp.]
MSCDGSNSASCNNIAEMYYKGQGVEEDKAKGIIYYKKSCDVGEWNSYIAYGNLGEYYHDNGDKFKATQYYKKACDLGKMKIEFFEVASPEYKDNWDNSCKMYEKLK